jgi:hypothetical protein
VDSVPCEVGRKRAIVDGEARNASLNGSIFDRPLSLFSKAWQDQFC